MSSPSNNPVLERRRETNGTLWVAIALSVALHVPLLFILPGAVEHDEALEQTEFNSAKEFSVSFVEQQEAKQKDKERDEALDGQFISAAPPEKQERPDEARFRDQYDSKTDEEMVKRTPSTNPNAPVSDAPDQGGRAAAPSEAGNPEARTAAEIRRQNEKQMRRADDKRVEAQEDGEAVDAPEPTEQTAEAGETADSSDPAEADEGLVKAEDEGQKLKKSIDPQELFPSFADASGVAAGGGSTDYMRDVPEGDKNLLNRKSSRYWSFMDRIRRQVQQQWSPVAEYRKRDPTGDVYGVKDKVSILGVTLNGDGSVRKIYVAHPSGLDFFDDEAVRAIRAASPFQNPPEGIKDQDGLIHFNFLFVLNIDSGGGPLLRIRRR